MNFHRGLFRTGLSLLMAGLLLAGCSTTKRPLAERTVIDDTDTATTVVDHKIEKNKKLARQFPEEPGYQETLAHLYWYSKRDHTEAVRHLDRARQIDPASARYDLLEARIYYAIGNWQGAEIAYRRVIDHVGPDYTGPEYELAWLYMLEQRHDEAEKGFFRCLEIDPELSGAYYGLGQIAAERGEEETAIGHLEKYLKMGGGVNTREALRVLHQLQPDLRKVK